jgi:hypothetical protein
LEDLLNLGSGSEAAPLQNLGISGRVQTAAELCHRMVDFCQRLTTAKRKILEDPDLYPEVCIHFTQGDLTPNFPTFSKPICHQTPIL